ncbi:hypothetical protein IWX49DRAFT_589283 [Phyllosticta citricarpa]|uniref:Uncharacterized protein n=1 Tax=Phyllosticta citricarpa TaxID=55181 RepID=A0ABR1MEL0_9PEZI
MSFSTVIVDAVAASQEWTINVLATSREVITNTLDFFPAVILNTATVLIVAWSFACWIELDYQVKVVCTVFAFAQVALYSICRLLSFASQSAFGWALVMTALTVVFLVAIIMIAEFLRKHGQLFNFLSGHSPKPVLDFLSRGAPW